eukprot:392391-Prorocentrum_minimum.AAC.1
MELLTPRRRRSPAGAVRACGRTRSPAAAAARGAAAGCPPRDAVPGTARTPSGSPPGAPAAAAPPPAGRPRRATWPACVRSFVRVPRASSEYRRSGRIGVSQPSDGSAQTASLLKRRLASNTHADARRRFRRRPFRSARRRIAASRNAKERRVGCASAPPAAACGGAAPACGASPPPAGASPPPPPLAGRAPPLGAPPPVRRRVRAAPPPPSPAGATSNRGKIITSEDRPSTRQKGRCTTIRKTTTRVRRAEARSWKNRIDAVRSLTQSDVETQATTSGLVRVSEARCPSRRVNTARGAFAPAVRYLARTL